MKKHFRVAIFGSARIKKGDPTYKLVHTLAKQIAMEGMDIVTGGGPGLMNAASEGHYHGRKDKALHSIGLTIKLPREQKNAEHLDVVKDFKKFSKRLDNFMKLSNVVVVAPGGVGTLLEFFYTWQLMQVRHICDIPIILMGDMYKDLMKWVKARPLRSKFLSKKDLETIFIVKNCSEAMDIIKEARIKYDEGYKMICRAINAKFKYA